MIYFATGNKGKAREAQQILDVDIEIAELELNEIQSLDPIEIVGHKVRQAFEKVKAPVFVDDVTLEMDVWKSFPGPFIKYIHEAGGNDLFLYMLRNEENRNASLYATIAYHDGKKIHYFSGKLRIKIALEKKGDGGWGLDPVIIPEGSTRTFSEMSEKEKNSNSHRSRALKKFKEFLDGQTQ